MIAQARVELPNECCGMLAGKLPAVDGNVVVAELYPLVNEEASPVEFLSDGDSMLRAEKARRNAGLEFLAVYHSHPTSPPVPSKTDLANNYSEGVMNLIISLLGDVPVVEAWWLTASDFRPAEWEIT